MGHCLEPINYDQVGLFSKKPHLSSSSCSRRKKSFLISFFFSSVNYPFKYM